MEIIGKSAPMSAVYMLIEKFAVTSFPVLITGESGTGKELVARAIHANSEKRAKPFIAINCGAFAQGIIDSELFGHVKGAFTGAVKDKKGCFERASGGTLFLDEVAELPKETQVKLLRVLQEGTFEPVGGEKTKKVDVRIISATNRNLELMMKRGEFREDLYYRLAVLPINLPPLRERREDIPLLVHHFLTQIPGVKITPEAMLYFRKYNWPGNVRQLKNIIWRCAAVCNGTISIQHLPPELTKTGRGRKKVLRREDVLAAIKRYGSVTKASVALRVSRATIYNYLKREE